MLSDRQVERYARHLVLEEIGEEGQERLLASSVLVVGAGGLGAPLLLYLAAAGIGRIGIIDDDEVELSNLQRQILYGEGDLGGPKAASAAARIAALNPDPAIEAIGSRLVAENAEAILARFDVIADGSDNFPTRYLLNDLCYRLGKPLVSAALLRFEAQLSTFKAHLGPPHPCYRCLFPEPPPPGLNPRCAEAGILGALAGVAGALQGVEVVKELLGLGESLSGRLLLYDALAADFRTIRLKRRADCPCCGQAGAR